MYFRDVKFKHTNMKKTSLFATIILSSFVLFSCVSKKKFKGLEADYLKKVEEFQECDIQNIKLKSSLDAKTEQVEDLKTQLSDCKKQRDNQQTTVGDLTVLSQQANQNISHWIFVGQKGFPSPICTVVSSNQFHLIRIDSLMNLLYAHFSCSH